jgi:RNA polymerase sigma-70 factor (ECF subfamily)
MTAITRNVASKCKDHLEVLPTISLEETNEAGLIAAEDEERDVRGVPLSEVVRMIDKLPEGYGQVFRLSVFEGMTHKEIATMLGIEPHSSSSQLARAKKMLRKMMQQYWVVGLLLLFIPITFFLFRKGDTAVKDEKPVVAKQKDTPKESQKDSRMEWPQEPVTVQMLRVGDGTSGILPVHRTTVIAPDTLQSVIAQAVDSVTSDTIATDTTEIIRKMEIPHYDMANLFPDRPVNDTSRPQRWTLELAYAGQLDEQNRYNQPFSYKPYIDPSIQHSPGEGPTYVVPSSIDNWIDYAVYLANNPDAVSAQTRSVIMRIALNNANQPGEDKILRTSHHRMPVTWLLALKYRLNNRIGVESGLSYSCLTSDFEMGDDGNTIREHQTIHYLGIPINGVYNMYSAKQWSLYGSFGLMTEIPIRSTVNTDYYLRGVYEASDESTLSAPWQFSTTFGLGLEYHLTPNIGFFIEPSLQYYIPMRTDIETYRTEHPFTISLPLGIRFTW